MKVNGVVLQAIIDTGAEFTLITTSAISKATLE